ncbi:hypothetical protein NXW90_00150 [Bacteroides fragilis]|nr:hypothetical protein [Bacteroides fragilis]UVR73393.1 hypothetical protein NXX35_21345 [Bacteroides xylanisolvens]
MSRVFPALFLPMPADSGMPTSLHVITMCPFGLMRLPSQNTVCEAKKFMLSCPIIEAMAKGPASGMCIRGIIMPPVSETPRFSPFTLTFVPRNGM